jgi:hypothetical protein
MRSVNGMIRITSFDVGLLKRSASGFACGRACGRAVVRRAGKYDWFVILDNNEDGKGARYCL